MTRSPEQREQAFGRRLRRHVTLGFSAGGVLGAGAGLVIGLAVFEAWSVAMWGFVIAGAVFGALIAAFIGGMSGLESPRPGQEPGESRSIEPSADEHEASDAPVIDERKPGRPVRLPTDPDVEPIRERRVE